MDTSINRAAFVAHMSLNQDTSYLNRTMAHLLNRDTSLAQTTSHYKIGHLKSGYLI